MNPFVHLGATEEIEVAHVAGDPLVRFGKGERELWVAVAAKGARERHEPIAEEPAAKVARCPSPETGEIAIHLGPA